MRITFDQAKRDRTLEERGLAFEDAAIIFGSRPLDIVDGRKDYGEPRVVTFGFLGGRLMAVVWTPRGDARHVISMRKANDREVRLYQERSREIGRDADFG